MPDDHHHPHQREHFARIRRVKFFLRFMPRRAVLHKYPLLGRFAAVARKRSYLWSFKTIHIRPALYSGSILSLMPFLGVQLPIALLLAVLLRANFMVLGGLQFITTPATALPIYYGTYQLGKAVISVSGFGHSIEVFDDPALNLSPVNIGNSDHAASDANPAIPPPDLRWNQRLGTRINALLLGGLIAGTALGALLDLLWRLGARQAESHRRKVVARQVASRSTAPPSDPL